ncbi:MAG: hypothetical protein V3U65_06450 [Granulosicoccaceae bacterium]
MTYLLTQMLISLGLAGIVGGAIAWLIQRSRATKMSNQLMETIHIQQLQSTQAESEITMMKDDFNELKQRNRAEMDVLAAEAKQVPMLKQNLEKSQLLVKQMMQKHEARLKELSDENATLMHRLKDITQREQVLDKIQAEINSDRRRGSSAAAGESVAAAVAATTGLLGSVSMATASSSDELDDVVSSNAVHGDIESKNASFDFEDQLDNEEDSNEINEPNGNISEEAIADNGTSAEQGEPVANSNNGTGGDEVEQIFTPAAQHDDLKQIFGIGPVTEKTLNKLGITSYSQLAELKQHDIDKIAEALQIFPGRIERDNWVGGARRQLQEVLEGL